MPSLSYKTFSTAIEASAFVAGVEYVNDSALVAYVVDEDPCCVAIEDRDGADEEEDTSDDPSGVFYDSIVGTAP